MLPTISIKPPQNPTRKDSAASRGGFWSLIATQFQGAFSDNALKNLVILLILDAGLSAASKNRLVPAVLLLFSLPFILFSMAGGFLADRFSKRSATIGTKLLEVCIALLALAGLWTANLPMELAAIFLFSMQAALFGPAKYGLLPELLPERDLSWGNGVLELGTFLAILTGTTAAGYLAGVFQGRQQWSGALLIALALIGLACSLGITRVPVADPSRRFQFNFLAGHFADAAGSSALASGDGQHIFLVPRRIAAAGGDSVWQGNASPQRFTQYVAANRARGWYWRGKSGGRVSISRRN